MSNAERGSYVNFDKDPSRTPTYTSEHDLSDHKPTSGEHDNLSRTRSWRKTLVFQVFALLWLAPMIFLLVINLRGWVIGPTIWCPSKRCSVDFFNFDTIGVQKQLLSYSHDDHNVLGGLQLVAKALEVWFETIAVYLVFLITMDIASLESGLPIGFLMRPFEFSRAPSLFDKLLWRSGPPLFGAKTKKSKAYRTRIYLYILMTICLCALCNLMGPSAAVLVLPVLQWVDMPDVGNTQFAAINAARPPRSDAWFWTAARAADLGCSPSAPAQGQYSCAQTSFGLALDSWVASYMSYGAGGTTQQYSLSFAINYTAPSTSSILASQVNNAAYWVPSRQTVSDVNNDLNALLLVKTGADGDAYRKANVSLDPFESYAAYNGSLQVDLQRNGPMIGALVSEWIGTNHANSWTTVIGPDLRVRCYEQYTLEFLSNNANPTTYTKCLRIGSGWSSANKVANFTILGVYDYSHTTLGPNVTVNVYSSDKAAFFPGGKFPDWFPSACRVNGTLPSGTDCDWNRLFQLDPSSPLANRSVNVNTIEMQMQDGASSAMLVADFTAFLGFTTYVLDPSPLTNPTSILTTTNIVQPPNKDPLVIDPAWILAAWSANNNTVSALHHLTGKFLVDTLSTLLTDTPDDDDKLIQALMVLLPITQTLSLIDYDTAPITTTTSSSSSSKQPTAAADSATNPPLLRSARLYVWAYGIGSRTGVLGVVVTTLGIAVTVLQFVLSMWNRRPFHSTTKLVVAALEHFPQEEFREKEQDECAAARTRFHISDNHHSAGKLTFRHTGVI
jgi:hypothetical protein